VLAWGEPIEEALAPICERFLRETTHYWQTWVKHCDVPPMYQEKVIRSALALKLHCFEDTGAIVAALTTSIPSRPARGRNWDYRYCWLRDSYYALGAFGLLGHFEEREKFLQFLLNVASASPDLDLAPLYRIDGGVDLEEAVLTTGPGTRANGPVRVGNAAASHLQHDVFGEMVLALAPLFLDKRFSDQVTPATLDLVSASPARPPRSRAARRGHLGVPLGVAPADLLLPHVLGRGRPHGDDRRRPQARRGGGVSSARDAHPRRDPPPGRRRRRAARLVESYGGTEVDAALLQAITLRLVAPDDPRATPPSTPCATPSSTAAGCAATAPTSSAVPTWPSSLHLLAHRGAGQGRAPRRGPRHDGPPRDGEEPARAAGRRPRPLHRRHVGQLPAGVLARRGHPRGLRGLAALVGGALTDGPRVRPCGARASP
jgi:hypothetical protein